MPLLLIRTNRPAPSSGEGGDLLREASRLVARELGKPERYVMMTLDEDVPMLFGGTPEPAAYLELKSIGLPQARTAELSAALTELVSAHLGVAADRVYIEFSNASGPLWGWNGSTF